MEQADRAVADLENQLKEAATQAIEAVNEEVSRTAAGYLVLKGRVESSQGPVSRARVVASLEPNPDDNCKEPDCTSDNTDSAGEFLLNLTKIYAKDEDHIILSVMSDGFDPFTKRVRLDVRAIDVTVPAQTVTLQKEALRRRVP